MKQEYIKFHFAKVKSFCFAIFVPNNINSNLCYNFIEVFNLLLTIFNFQHLDNLNTDDTDSTDFHRSVLIRKIRVIRGQPSNIVGYKILRISI